MPNLTVSNASAVFPPGTNVKAIALKGPETILPTSGPGAGAVIETIAVAANGELTFAGLTEGSFYRLAAEVSGEWRYMHVYLDYAGDITVIATQATGDFGITTAGKTLRIKEGSNAKMGSGTLVAGKATIANTSVTAESRIFLTRTGAIAAAGALSVTAKVAGTSFTVESASGTDTGTFNYLILEPA